MRVKFLLFQLLVREVERSVQVLGDVLVELLELFIQSEILIFLKLFFDKKWQKLLDEV